MSAPNELSFDEILKFMLAHNGKVTNHELVKHFKVFLTNPDMRDEARNTFKKHVNSLAIIKNQNNEKWLILKKKYMPSLTKDNEISVDKQPESPAMAQEAPLDDSCPEPVPERPPLPMHLNQNLSLLNNIIQQNAGGNYSEDTLTELKENVPPVQVDDEPPKIHPRRRSSADKEAVSDRNSIPNSPGFYSPNHSIDDNVRKPIELSTSKSEVMLVDSEHKISVKERKQMFNRMASEGDILKPHQTGNFGAQGVDEDDRVSVVSLDHKAESDPLDSKQKAWILCAARGEYHALAKMCSENSKLAKTKDPFTTAMHWACKRGDENLVKLLAGVSRNLVNERSGYTPLHIAMQFRHENVYRLLVEVYDADPNIRDWSGKKPRQYLVHIDTSLSPGSYRKKEGFLRIGSLNVRVKKTTEAFSNFLGVGATRSSAYVSKSARGDPERRVSEDLEHLHKTWGSADNIQKNDKLMPPPLSNKVRRRGVSGRKGVVANHSRSTPSTPDQVYAYVTQWKKTHFTVLKVVSQKLKKSAGKSAGTSV